MVGIKEISSYIPSKRVSNIERKETFSTDEDFILNKIGIVNVAVKENNENTSDLAIKAFRNLEKKIAINKEEIEVALLVTQNPDSNIPHTSAIIHGALDFPESCACFDISLGCSGFVYGLSIIKSFMESNRMKKGLLFTCDPYSKIIDPADKNTALLFGDAATVTYLTEDPAYTIGNFTFGTIGKESSNLTCTNNVLSMNGRGIFNFAAKYIPVDLKNLLQKNHLEIKDINKFIFHQGSKYIVDTLIKRTSIDASKVIFDIADYGNTVSSSIPIILEKILHNTNDKYILISGFGVGLSWSSNVLINHKN
ncbi:MAG TPA: ketoacyl-ACP synthase III [Parafilimonas sp.]|nr:ketoacyl-ACP synthase III [Parafilimonas sp.]